MDMNEGKGRLQAEFQTEAVTEQGVGQATKMAKLRGK